MEPILLNIIADSPGEGESDGQNIPNHVTHSVAKQPREVSVECMLTGWLNATVVFCMLMLYKELHVKVGIYSLTNMEVGWIL